MRAGDLSTREPAAWTAVRLTLTRHQRRRDQGIPTLGVLVGAPADAEAAWQDWAQSTGREASIRDAEDESEGKPESAALYVCRASCKAGLTRIVERLCRRLATAGPAGTSDPLALALAPAEAAAFLRDEPFSRTRTLFAEGMVTLPGATPRAADQETHGGSTPGTSGGPPASSLAKWPLRPETAASFDAATAALRAVDAARAADARENDRARSAAERFLFDLLGDLPETAGLFELNARLAFCFGPLPAEVDLLAAGLRLAVEIDGFHHFRDPDRYRRDRRKDALLQRQGFLVLRFLAEDVVVRLEEILEEIRTTVAFRRATLR